MFDENVKFEGRFPDFLQDQICQDRVFLRPISRLITIPKNYKTDSEPFLRLNSFRLIPRLFLNGCAEMRAY